MVARHAVIAGGGIGGLAAAVALHRRGWQVIVCERASEVSRAGAGLGLGPNALRALDAIGLGDKVRGFSAVQGHGGIRRADGRWLVRTDLRTVAERFGDPQIIALRSDLTRLLAARLPEGSLHTSTTVTAVDTGDAGRLARVSTSAGELDANLVVAADGLRSQIRAGLFPGHPGPRYAGFTAWRLLAPTPPGGVEPAETWGTGAVFGIVPLADGRVYCYATAAAPPGGHDGSPEELQHSFARWHDPIPQILSSVAAGDTLRDDIYWLDRPLPAYHAGRAAIIGDAAHAMTPNLGQGACQAIEDAIVLASVAGEPPGPADLTRYTAARLRRTRMIAERSYRLSRLTGLTARPAVYTRDAALWLAGRLGPGMLPRMMAPLANWNPPPPE